MLQSTLLLQNLALLLLSTAILSAALTLTRTSNLSLLHFLCKAHIFSFLVCHWTATCRHLHASHLCKHLGSDLFLIIAFFLFIAAIVDRNGLVLNIWIGHLEKYLEQKCLVALGLSNIQLLDHSDICVWERFDCFLHTVQNVEIIKIIVSLSDIMKKICRENLLTQRAAYLLFAHSRPKRLDYRLLYHRRLGQVAEISDAAKGCRC